MLRLSRRIAACPSARLPFVETVLSSVLWPAELDSFQISRTNLVVAELGLAREGERAPNLHLDLVPFAERYLGDEALGGISGKCDRFDVVEGDTQVPSAELSGKRELAAGVDPF